MPSPDYIAELQADHLLLKAKAEERQEAEQAGIEPDPPEYPFYTESYLDEKRRRHEDRYADPPELESVIDGEIDEFAEADLWYWGDRANLTERQHFAWTRILMDKCVAEVRREWLKLHGEDLSFNAVKEWLAGARRKVIREVARDRYAGWYVVYLEEVTRRHMF